MSSDNSDRVTARQFMDELRMLTVIDHGKSVVNYFFFREAGRGRR